MHAHYGKKYFCTYTLKLLCFSGAHVSYQPFDVEDYQEAASDDEDMPMQFPPRTEISDDRKNWPKSCPFLHMKFEEMAIQVCVCVRVRYMHR